MIQRGSFLRVKKLTAKIDYFVANYNKFQILSSGAQPQICPWISSSGITLKFLGNDIRAPQSLSIAPLQAAGKSALAGLLTLCDP